MLSPYVGILVNDRMYRRIPLGRTKYEIIDYYVEAGRRHGFTPCFFRIQDLDAAAPHVLAYVRQPEGYRRIRVPSPQIIHNRAIFRTRSDYRKLQAWSEGGVRLFNSWNRYGKLHIHRLLAAAPDLEPHLPETRRATSAAVTDMMKRHDALILKPNKSSIGRGIMKLSRSAAGWKLTYPATLSVRNRRWRTLRFAGPRLPAALLARLRRTPYLVQQCLPLATYRGRPFDLRVSVQRGMTGEWQVTGIVAKVARKGIFLTNVAQGGSVFRLEPLVREAYPHWNPHAICEGVSTFALRVARRLSECLPHMADLGLDIGLNDEGMPLFIECNGKDQRYSFREAGMYEEWKATYENPMAYAKYLMEENEGQNAGACDSHM